MPEPTIAVKADDLRKVVYESLRYEGTSIWARVESLCRALGYKGQRDFLRRAPGSMWHPQRGELTDFGYGE